MGLLCNSDVTMKVLNVVFLNKIRPVSLSVSDRLMGPLTWAVRQQAVTELGGALIVIFFLSPRVSAFVGPNIWQLQHRTVPSNEARET